MVNVATWNTMSGFRNVEQRNSIAQAGSFIVNYVEFGEVMEVEEALGPNPRETHAAIFLEQPVGPQRPSESGRIWRRCDSTP